MNATGGESKRAYEDWHARFEVDAATDTPWHTLVKGALSGPRDLAGKKILEIGSGRGGFASWLASHDSKPRLVVAADFAVSAVRKGREHALDQGTDVIAWEVGDIQAIAHDDRTFDTVFSCETIEHVPDPGHAVQELARVLKSGGRLFLTTPNYLGPMGLFRVYRRLAGRPYTEEGQPINQLTMLPRTRRWIRRAGLVTCETQGTGHYIPLPGRIPRAIPWPERISWLTRWVALHSMVIAVKP